MRSLFCVIVRKDLFHGERTTVLPRSQRTYAPSMLMSTLHNPKWDCAPTRYRNNYTGLPVVVYHYQQAHEQMTILAAERDAVCRLTKTICTYRIHNLNTTATPTHRPMLPPSPDLQPNPQSPKHPNRINRIPSPSRILFPRQPRPPQRSRIKHAPRINTRIGRSSPRPNDGPVFENGQAVLAKVVKLESKCADLEDQEEEEDVRPVGEATTLGLRVGFED